MMPKPRSKPHRKEYSDDTYIIPIPGESRSSGPIRQARGGVVVATRAGAHMLRFFILDNMDAS